MSVFSKKIAKFHKIGKPYCETLGMPRTLRSSNVVENGYECGVGWVASSWRQYMVSL